MITFRQALDAMGIPYVDDGSAELDYELRIFDDGMEDTMTVEVRGLVNDHKMKQVIISNMEIGE